MTPAEFDEFRQMIDAALAGTLRPQEVGVRLAELMGLYYEANYQAKLRGEPGLPSFLSHCNPTKEELRRFAEVTEAMCDVTMPKVEWLPVDAETAEDGL